MNVTRWRLSVTRRLTVECAVVQLLTSMFVLNLLAEGTPTLITGMRTRPSCLILVGLTLKESITIVLVPCCMGKLVKKLRCLVVPCTGQGIALQLEGCSVELRLVKTPEPN